MNIEKSLITLVIIAASLIVTILVAQLLPIDTKYIVIFGALLLGCGGAIKPVTFLFSEKRLSILSPESSRRSS